LPYIAPKELRSKLAGDMSTPQINAVAEAMLAVTARLYTAFKVTHELKKTDGSSHGLGLLDGSSSDQPLFSSAVLSTPNNSIDPFGESSGLDSNWIIDEFARPCAEPVQMGLEADPKINMYSLFDFIGEGNISP
jgi:hypothetical protein